jgi:hypothetical protein
MSKIPLLVIDLKGVLESCSCIIELTGSHISGYKVCCESSIYGIWLRENVRKSFDRLQNYLGGFVNERETSRIILRSSELF